MMPVTSTITTCNSLARLGRTLPLLVLGCWQLLPAVEAHADSVRQFGARGDGITDDTEAVERAVASGCGDIEFPSGTYRLTRTVRIALDVSGPVSLSGRGTARIHMEGSGPAFHFLGTHSGSADPGQFTPEIWLRQRMPQVRSLEIIGAQPDADGIEATGVMQLTLDGLLIRQCRHAIRLTKRNRNLLVSNCHLYQNRGAGIFYDAVNLHQSNIVGCHISYCAGGGVVIRGGEVRNVHIGTCDIESNMAPDAPPTANVLIDCTDGSTAEVAITGCTLQHNSKSPGSANIRFLGRGITSSRDATPTQEGHLTITGNVFSDCMTNIHLQHVRGASITGNTFWEGFEQDLLLEDCRSVVIGPNDLDRNPRYVVNGNWAKDRGGVRLVRCTDCKLHRLLIQGVWRQPAAVQLENCRRVTLRDLSLLDCDGLGVLLTDCTNCHVTDCVISDTREATDAAASPQPSTTEQPDTEHPDTEQPDTEHPTTERSSRSAGSESGAGQGTGIRVVGGSGNVLRDNILEPNT
jgi:hypothetical protein